MNDTGVHPSSFISRLRGLWPLGPIFTKELRQIARRKRSYLLRFLYLAVLLGILSLTWYGSTESYRYQMESIVQQAQKQATLGKFFFIAFSMFTVCAMQLLGPVLTSTAIGSERLRRTFDVLLMTPISSWQIVTGKLFSRLLTALMLIGLTLPVLAIVRLLGGVELADMFGVLALSACAAMATSALGLLFSCFLKRAWAVILLSYMTLAVVHAIVPLIILFFIRGMFQFTPRRNFLWIIEALITSNPTVVTTVNLFPGSGMYIDWKTACVIQIIAAGLLTLIASNVVRRIGRKSVSGDFAGPPTMTPKMIEIPAQSPQSESHETQPQYQPPSLNRPRFTSNYPLLQHELSRPLFAKVWQRTTCITLVLGLLFLSYLGVASNSSYSPNYPSLLQDRDTHVGYLFIFFTLFTLTNVVLSSTAIATEKESDTWTLLIVSPLSGSEILWGKYMGIVRRLFWPLMLIIAHLLIFTMIGAFSVVSTLIAIWITLTFNSLWLATGIYLSLRSSKVTLAVVLNLMMVIAIYAAAPIVLSITNVRSYNSFDPSELFIYWLPYWYLEEGLFNYHDLIAGTFYNPATGSQIPQFFVVIYAFFAGIAYLLLAFLVMFYANRQFDRIVGRAKSFS